MAKDERKRSDIHLLFKRALVMHQSGNFNEARSFYKQVLEEDQNHFDSLHLLGLTYVQLGEPEEGASYILRALEVKDDFAEAHYNLATTLMALNRHSEAFSSLKKALQLKPDDAEFHLETGKTLHQLGRFDEAIKAFDQAINLRKSYAEAYRFRGYSFLSAKLYDEALADFDEAIRARPDYVEAYLGCAKALSKLREYGAALRTYDKVIDLRPDSADAYFRRGDTLVELRRLDEAVDSYDRAISLRPNFSRAHNRRGDVLEELDRLEEALASYDRALKIEPDISFLKGSLLHTKAKICEWSNFESHIKEIAEDVSDSKLAIRPFPALSLFDDPKLHFDVSTNVTKNLYPPALDGHKFHLGHIRRKKIRIGYYTSDFRQHAGATLMAELFEAHDRNDFEIFAFSFSPRTSDPMQRRLMKSFDGFIDVKDQSDVETVQLSRQMGIDIAVNRNGYTKYHRNGIFAGRSAPIQVSFLGFPGTTGASYIDYIIADRVVMPEENKTFFSESVVYMPDSYQVNSKREISDKRFSRKDVGLPEGWFVFCCFNNSYKIMPDTFSSWMRILRRVDQSVLWLLGDNPSMIRNLRNEAENQGVNSGRLVFADRLPHHDHLARHSMADLFLDTLPYNAHTTASDALWTGLPVLTCSGRSFAARVSASLLTALGVPELIVGDMLEYENAAVAFASNPTFAAGIRNKIAENRTTSSLFDAGSFARNLELAYREMYDRYCKGLPCDQIVVQDLLDGGP